LTKKVEKRSVWVIPDEIKEQIAALKKAEAVAAWAEEGQALQEVAAQKERDGEVERQT
jgi:hypothetical protein